MPYLVIMEIHILLITMHLVTIQQQITHKCMVRYQISIPVIVGNKLDS